MFDLPTLPAIPTIFETGSYSPALAIVTAVGELAAARWVLQGPGRRWLLRHVAALLVLLAGYQVIEVFVCARPDDNLLARLAFADVVWLPALGVALIVRLSSAARGWQRHAMHAFLGGAGALTAWVLLDPEAVTGTICHAVIATYRNPSEHYVLYGAFYQLGLMSMIFGAGRAAASCNDELRRRHLIDIQTGTLAFVLPSLLAVSLLPQAEGAMPSVMCHFAALLAVFLVRLVVRERLAHSPVGAHVQGEGRQTVS